MFEERSHAFVVVDENAIEIEALSSLGNSQSVPQVAPPNPGFQLPRSIWISMFGAYAAFFVAILIATGGSGHAVFAIAVSAIYTAIYFGAARIAARQAGPEDVSPLDRGEPLETWTGPMDATSVYSQILIVPACVTLFGLAVLVITSLTNF